MSRPADLSGSETVSVAAGILIDPDGRILIARRPDDGRHGGGYWEFPGGKVKSGESPDSALVRELAEELGIVVGTSVPFAELLHQYPERKVRLAFRLVQRWAGRVRAREQQDLAWVRIDELDAYTLLAADAPVIEQLKRRLGPGPP